MNRLDSVRIGKNYPVRIMGILNASPESFLESSVRTSKKAIEQAAISMVDNGADIIDIGGMSSAPYRSTLVSMKTETERIVRAVRIVSAKTNVPISVDTCRARVANAALDEGATIINDITGLHYDKKMHKVINDYNPSLVLCAHSTRRLYSGNPIIQAVQLLEKSVNIARSYGIPSSNIVLDPAIGFFRRTGNGSRFTRASDDWLVRDLLILGGLEQLGSKLQSELLVSVSNKSFLGKLDHDASPEHRLAGSLAAELTAAIKGVGVIRTHNVADTHKVLSTLSA